MQRRNFIIAGLSLSPFGATWAGTTINTIGSNSGLAINGFDTVAFHTDKKAIKGSAEFSYEWNQAVWYFTSAANRDRFKADPTKYAPEFGGHCALGVSDGYISQKATDGEFEIYQSKLYLFPPAAGGNPTGVKTAWWKMR